MTTNLDSKIKDLLNAKRGDWPQIASASGVSYSWLSKFVNGHIPNPGYTTLVKLHECLKSQRSPRKAASQGVIATSMDETP